MNLQGIEVLRNRTLDQVPLPSYKNTEINSDNVQLSFKITQFRLNIKPQGQLGVLHFLMHSIHPLTVYLDFRQLSILITYSVYKDRISQFFKFLFISVLFVCVWEIELKHDLIFTQRWLESMIPRMFLVQSRRQAIGIERTEDRCTSKLISNIIPLYGAGNWVWNSLS